MGNVFSMVFSLCRKSEEESEYTEEDSYESYRLNVTDGPRVKAYKKAVVDNQAQIKGKVVLDVGAGTGLFSAFFANAEAKTVYAVEEDDIYKIAEAVAEGNNASHIINVIHKDIDDIDIRDVSEKVDIIVSDWMGLYLFNNAILDSVLSARDRFLKPDGLMFPESAVLYSAPCRVPLFYEVWDNVEGFSMRSFGETLRKIGFDSPYSKEVDPNNILSDPVPVIGIDLREITYERVENIKTQLIAVANKEGWCQGICLWFTVTFPSPGTEPVTLSTGPEELKTAWAQTVMVLPEQIDVVKGAPIAYEVSLARDLIYIRQYKLKVKSLDPNTITHPENCVCNKCVHSRAKLQEHENSVSFESINS